MNSAADICAERDLALMGLEGAAPASQRALAAEALVDLALDAPRELQPDFQPALVRLLADGQPEVRCAGLALCTLVLDAGEAMEILVRHLGSADQRLRVEAAGRLADLALPESRGALAAALEDAALAVRFEAARGMVALKHPAGFEVLVEALGDVHLRFRAASALATLGNKSAIGPLKQAFSGWLLPAFDKTQLAGALAVLGDPDGVAHLFKRAGRSWSTMDRAMAVELLGESKAPGALGRLLEILRAEGDPARGAAARGLGRLKDAAAEASLQELLGSPRASDDLKLDAAEGLLMLGGSSALASVSALKLGDPAAAEELGALLQDFARSPST